MNIAKTESVKKKGILTAIWDSMTKTGGCCGSGDNCGCGPAKPQTSKNSSEPKSSGREPGRVDKKR